LLVCSGPLVGRYPTSSRAPTRSPRRRWRQSGPRTLAKPRARDPTLIGPSVSSSPRRRPCATPASGPGLRPRHTPPPRGGRSRRGPRPDSSRPPLSRPRLGAAGSPRGPRVIGVPPRKSTSTSRPGHASAHLCGVVGGIAPPGLERGARGCPLRSARPDHPRPPRAHHGQAGSLVPVGEAALFLRRRAPPVIIRRGESRVTARHALVGSAGAARSSTATRRVPGTHGLRVLTRTRHQATFYLSEHKFRLGRHAMA
jgi:hypothetical protein